MLTEYTIVSCMDGYHISKDGKSCIPQLQVTASARVYPIAKKGTAKPQPSR